MNIPQGMLRALKWCEENEDQLSLQKRGALKRRNDSLKTSWEIFTAMNEKTRSELLQKIVDKYPDWSNYKLMDYFGRLFSADKMTKEEIGNFNLQVMKALRNRKVA